MIEAVGANYFDSFMTSLDALLAPRGRIVLQAIMIPEGLYAAYVRSTDFINTVIFPGGCCPSLAALTASAAKHTQLNLVGVDSFGLHYAETLRRWRANFNAALEVVRALGFDDDFIRTWNYYLTYCEAGFAAGALNLQVLTWARAGAGQVELGGAPYGRRVEAVGRALPEVAVPW